MKTNVLFTLGVGLITAGLGFIAGSKWTEKKIRHGLEDLYQQEYNLLKKKLEEDYENAKKSEEKKASDETEKREFEEIERENYVYESLDDDFDEDLEETEVDEESKVSNPAAKRPHKTTEEIERYTEIMNQNEYYKNGDPNYPYIIPLEQYYEDKDYEDKHMTWDSENSMLIDDDDPHKVIEDIDELVSYEALDILDSAGESVVVVRNERLQTDFVIEKFCPRN